MSCLPQRKTNEVTSGTTYINTNCPTENRRSVVILVVVGVVVVVVVVVVATFL